MLANRAVASSCFLTKSRIGPRPPRVAHPATAARSRYTPSHQAHAVQSRNKQQLNTQRETATVIHAVITGLAPPLIVLANRLSRGGRVVAGAPSAWRPYDCAYDVRIQRQAAPASPLQRVQRGIRPAERLAPHEARRRLTAPEAGREGVVQPSQPKPMLPARGGSMDERPAYRGRAYERPAYGAPVHDLPNQTARSWDAR